jgi:hypothetical protein
MSDLELFRDKSAVIPAHLQKGPIDALTKSLMGTSDSKRISIRGNIFRMIVGGQEVAKNEDRAMDVVIIRAAEHTSRSYYAGTYVEGSNALPDCWSTDGTKPDGQVKAPQASACAMCPMNAAGSGQGTSKACRYSRRLAVLLGNDINNSDVYQLVLPAQSIFGKGESGKMPLGQYAKFIGGHGLSVSSVVTEMRFDTSSATPKLTFRAVRPLTVDEMALAIEKGESEDAITAVTYNPAQVDRGEAGKPQAAAPAEKDPELFRDLPKRGAAKAEKPAEEKPVEAAAEPEEPKVRETKKSAPAAEPEDLDSVLDAWGDDD